MSLWLSSMRQTVKVKRWLRGDFQGSAEYGPAEPFPCRWQPGSRLVPNERGITVVAEGTLFTTARVGPKDLLWLPGADASSIGQSRKALRVYERNDLETGAFDHAEVVL